MEHADVLARLDAVPYWWHTIDVGGGILTPGAKWGGGAAVMEAELARQHIPADLSGKTVLDIGAYDGFYSFEAERRGASRVLALDHFVWLNDLRDGGLHTDLSLQYLPPDGLPQAGAPTPGKAAFDLVCELRASAVESLVADFMHVDLERVGTFDITFYLGVLYHMEEPLAALRRLRQVTRELAIIESEVCVLEGLEELAVAEFVPERALNDDQTNWWVPSVTALEGLVRAAGFTEVSLVDGPSPPAPDGTPFHRARATVHARP